MATPNTTNGKTQDKTTNQSTENRARPEEPRAAHAATRGPEGERSQQVPISREGEREARPGTQRGGMPARRGGGSGGLPTYGTYVGPFALMQQLQSEMDRLFEDFGFGRGLTSPFGSTARGLRAGGGLGGSGQAPWSPQLDVFRRGDELVVHADLPGLAKEDVTVDLEDGVLTIRGERRHEATDDREGYYWSERSYGSFERSVPLPEGIDESQAQASFRDGVLEVTVPAPKADKPRGRRIEIR